MTTVETIVAALVTADTRRQHSIGRLSDRVERIERRFDLVDESVSPPL